MVHCSRIKYPIDRIACRECSRGTFRRCLFAMRCEHQSTFIIMLDTHALARFAPFSSLQTSRRKIQSMTNVYVEQSRSGLARRSSERERRARCGNDQIKTNLAPTTPFVNWTNTYVDGKKTFSNCESSLSLSRERDSISVEGVEIRCYCIR